MSNTNVWVRSRNKTSPNVTLLFIPLQKLYKIRFHIRYMFNSITITTVTIKWTLLSVWDFRVTVSCSNKEYVYLKVWPKGLTVYREVQSRVQRRQDTETIDVMFWSFRRYDTSSSVLPFFAPPKKFSTKGPNLDLYYKWWRRV